MKQIFYKILISVIFAFSLCVFNVLFIHYVMPFINEDNVSYFVIFAFGLLCYMFYKDIDKNE